MDREKLIEAIRLSIARVLDFKTDRRELECLADHLIANGIGDITAEKYRAEVAEDILKRISRNYYMTGTEALIDSYKQQAEARLKELRQSQR